VLDSNVGRGTGCSDSGFSKFSSVLPANMLVCHDGFFNILCSSLGINHQEQWFSNFFGSRRTVKQKFSGALRVQNYKYINIF
jgi:hypothetical protein